jgi:hypothetical protein
MGSEPTSSPIESWRSRLIVPGGARTTAHIRIERRRNDDSRNRSISMRSRAYWPLNLILAAVVFFGGGTSSAQMKPGDRRKAYGEARASVIESSRASPGDLQAASCLQGLALLETVHSPGSRLKKHRQDSAFFTVVVQGTYYETCQGSCDPSFSIAGSFAKSQARPDKGSHSSSTWRSRYEGPRKRGRTSRRRP